MTGTRATVLIAGGAACLGTAQINTSRAFGPGRCGPVDPTYLKTVEETGGQLFLLSPSELAASGHVMSETSRGSDELIAWAAETAPSASRQFAIQVDPSIERISLSAMFDGTGGSLVLASPDNDDRTFAPGRETSVTFTIRNAGPAARFRLLAIDGIHFASASIPRSSSSTLAPNALSRWSCAWHRRPAKDRAWI